MFDDPKPASEHTEPLATDLAPAPAADFDASLARRILDGMLTEFEHFHVQPLNASTVVTCDVCGGGRTYRITRGDPMPIDLATMLRDAIAHVARNHPPTPPPR